jgi:SAM-dependent methyltransferase
MLNRGDLFLNEYESIKNDTNYYHSLHEQVMLSHDEKTLDHREHESGISRLRGQLSSKASGIVLETNIGTHRNFLHYDFGRITKLIGCDWVQSGVTKSEQKDSTSTIIMCDTNKLPFPDSQFDTIVDTFGLECSYDLEHSYSEMKRLVKPGGKILLLERGLGFWMQDNFQLMRRASVNLGARG